MPVLGQELVAANITRFGGGFIKHVNKVMKTAIDRLDIEVTKNISETTYSLKDLAMMDHPYAKRHGTKGKQIHDPYFKVHQRTGKLKSSKKTGVIPATISGGNLKAAAFIEMVAAKAPHAVFVLFGTSKMIPRDFLRGSLDIVKRDVNDILKLGLRDFVFRFR